MSRRPAWLKTVSLLAALAATAGCSSPDAGPAPAADASGELDAGGGRIDARERSDAGGGGIDAGAGGGTDAATSGCEDESACGCGADEFRCLDGTCIPAEWACDGEYTDCPEGDDEAESLCGSGSGGGDGGPTDGPACGPDCTPSGGSATMAGGYVAWSQELGCTFHDDGEGAYPGEACSYFGTQCHLVICDCCADGGHEQFGAAACVDGICAGPVEACERALEVNLSDDLFGPLCD